MRDSPPDLFFLDREVDRHREDDARCSLPLEQQFPEGLKAPKGTKYICAKAGTCQYGPLMYKDSRLVSPCKHSLPHRHNTRCAMNHNITLRGTNGLSMSHWTRVKHESGGIPPYAYSYWRWIRVSGCNCVADLDTCQYPTKEATPKRLKAKKVEVICPAAIDRCIGKCAHAKPHKHNKYCKDTVVNGEMRLHCQPVGHNKKRSLMFKDFDLHCHRR